MPLPPVETLTAPALAALVASGKVLEASFKLGPKVIDLGHGHYFKLLRVKSRFSTWGLLNPAKRFARNAEKLRALGIPTVTVEALCHLPDKKCWGVRYQGLEGRTLRELVKRGELTDAQLDQLVSFIKTLHERGVYFRGLHIGNILLTPDGQLGLIDILDCYFRPYLFAFQRQRNFKHLFPAKDVDARPLEARVRARYAQLG
jgi:serine/threonine protein kinase